MAPLEPVAAAGGGGRPTTRNAARPRFPSVRSFPSFFFPNDAVEVIPNVERAPPCVGAGADEVR